LYAFSANLFRIVVVIGLVPAIAVGCYFLFRPDPIPSAVTYGLRSIGGLQVRQFTALLLLVGAAVCLASVFRLGPITCQIPLSELPSVFNEFEQRDFSRSIRISNDSSDLYLIIGAPHGEKIDLVFWTDNLDLWQELYAQVHEYKSVDIISLGEDTYTVGVRYALNITSPGIGGFVTAVVKDALELAPSGSVRLSF